LTIWPTAMEVLEVREDETSGGKALHVARIRVTYQLTDPDDGDQVLVQALGEGSDSGDKVLNKCMTAALKYVLRQACLISTAEDPDHAPSASSRSRRTAETVPICSNCKKPIGPVTQGGQVMRTAKEVLALSMEREGVALCAHCFGDRQHAKKDKPDPAEAERLALVAKANGFLAKIDPGLHKTLVGEKPLADCTVDELHTALEALEKHAAERGKA